MPYRPLSFSNLMITLHDVSKLGHTCCTRTYPFNNSCTRREECSVLMQRCATSPHCRAKEVIQTTSFLVLQFPIHPQDHYK